jgi:hypothetical protein
MNPLPETMIDDDSSRLCAAGPAGDEPDRLLAVDREGR